MPDTSALLWGLLFSSIGLGYFVYGRKQRRPLVFWTGVALIIYPYFVASPLILIGIGVALLAVPFVIR